MYETTSWVTFRCNDVITCKSSSSSSRARRKVITALVLKELCYNIYVLDAQRLQNSVQIEWNLIKS